MSLPLALGIDVRSIPAPRQYLYADPDVVSLWSHELRSNARLRVGIAWSGNRAHPRNQTRSVELTKLLECLPGDSVCVNIQRDMSEAERSSLETRSDVLHFPDALKDFANTAALCMNLDVLVSVDTSIAHLGGALGLPTFVLLEYSPDWRWMLGRADSPWYPSMRLFRQAQRSDWSAPLAELAAELRRRAAHTPASRAAGKATVE